MKKTIVNIRSTKSGVETWVTVRGIILPGFAEGQDCVLHKGIGDNAGNWAVSDRLSGKRISDARCTTRKEALHSARKMADKHSTNYLDLSCKAIINSYRIERNKLREINDYRRKSLYQQRPISVDDVLDFAKIAQVTVSTFQFE